MTIYQISVRSFFTSNGCDYATPVDPVNDIVLCTDHIKAQKAFTEFENKYTSIYNLPAQEIKSPTMDYVKVIYHDDARTYIEMVKKNI